MKPRAAVHALSCALVLVAFGCEEDDVEEIENVVVNAPEGDDPAEELIEELPGVETYDLEGAERRAWVRLVNQQLSPCGEPVSVARCVTEERACGKCKVAAEYIARLLAEGAEPSEIRELYRNRYSEEAIYAIDIEGAPVRGTPMGAAVTIVEFSDFECPYCGQAHPMLQRILRRFEGRVRMVFKHYPLSGHEHAVPAARAAVAAMRQGKFWEMHDMLFENQDALEPSDLVRYAERIGLDVARFRADLEADETQALIDENRAQGQEAGVRGTPSIYINGHKFEEPLESLEEYVREELEQT
ncbi:MAG: thioredoxin domain-containing protein [Myxococcota bacterium]